MKVLTEVQKVFLLTFFENEKYCGWGNIARSLLESGECVVPGDKCIWVGGIGNFIKTETVEHFHGCLKYVFDLEYFMTSAWYKEEHFIHMQKLSQKYIDVQIEYTHILNLK